VRVCQFGGAVDLVVRGSWRRVGVGNVHSGLLPKQAFCSGSPERMIVPTFTACRVELLSMAAPPPTHSLSLLTAPLLSSATRIPLSSGLSRKRR
jgi:hypothetical protein